MKCDDFDEDIYLEGRILKEVINDFEEGKQMEKYCFDTSLLLNLIGFLC